MANAAPTGSRGGFRGVGGGRGGGNQVLQQTSDKSADGGMQSRGNSGLSARSYKEMVEGAKKLHNEADKLQDRICRLHCGFADLTLKAAFLFDPMTVQLLSDSYPEIGGIPDIDTVHFTRQSVNDSYIELSQALSGRPDHQRN